MTDENFKIKLVQNGCNFSPRVLVRMNVRNWFGFKCEKMVEHFVIPYSWEDDPNTIHENTLPLLRRTYILIKGFHPAHILCELFDEKMATNMAENAIENFKKLLNDRK